MHLLNTFKRYFICVKFNKMENLFTKTAVLLSRLIIIAFYTAVTTAPFFVLFYLIIFNNLELFSEINLKYYSIAYFMGFLTNYNYIVRGAEKEEKIIN